MGQFYSQLHNKGNRTKVQSDSRYSFSEFGPESCQIYNMLKYNENSFLRMNEIELPEEIFLSILSHLDSKTLLNCRLINQLWRYIIDNHIWKYKIRREQHYSLRVTQYKDGEYTFPWIAFYKICTKDPFGRNLIKNHCGQEQFDHWNILSNSGDHWHIEIIPNGADALPHDKDFSGLTSCFATSYHSCSKVQVVNLAVEGVIPQVMDKMCPHITVSEWFAGRFDCGCVYELRVNLLDENKAVLETFEHRETIDQWQGREWKKVSHNFTDYKPGVRYVEFYHGGMDTQYWAGHYGSKMSGASVRLQLVPH